MKCGPLPRSYEPEKFESEVYAHWESAGYFSASDTSDKGQDAFSLMIPPPNVTGVLHMGHALTSTIEDILVRWHRMRGFNTLWMPGTDHAGIATQAQVEKALSKEGKSRHTLGRKTFVERVWKWKDDHGAAITQQLRRMGCSLDWSRERFTMDEGFSRAVREAFVQLYEDGLIFRGERIINWCVRCQTALSDLEVIPTDRKSQLYKIRYPFVGGGSAPIVATTRPETLLGDTALAVHPDDERFKHLHGKKVQLPLTAREIPVIVDAYVDREFGTGALKVTPAHDFNDFEIGKRHTLPPVSVMGKDGKITSEGGSYAGLKFDVARAKILEDLAAQGLLVGTEGHTNKVGLCQRCDSVAEPLLSKQWFVKAEVLAKPAIEAVRSGRVTITPKNWEKTYFEWMENIRDWCISRQLWWGHQIPAWHCECGEITVARESPKACSKCKGTNLKQDEDVLDTWFSSGLWPFATLGWPEKTAALKTFYPTSILETGFDILFFWVARMMMFGLHFMGDVPFRKIYLHAMVRDEQGHKMSKSRGNVVDPLGIIEKLGADPLRFGLAIMAGQGRDIKLSLPRLEGYRAFCNKLWNAVQFLLLQVGSWVPEGGAGAWVSGNIDKLPDDSKWLLGRLESTIQSVTHSFENFELNVGTQAIYDFVWKDICDWGIELAKIGTREGDPSRLYVLHHCLEEVLKLAHPIIPFVTERLWQELPWRCSKLDLCIEHFPKPSGRGAMMGLSDFDQAIEIVDALRKFRGENSLPMSREFQVHVNARDSQTQKNVTRFEKEISGLTKVKLLFTPLKTRTTSLIPLPHLGLELAIELEGLVDLDADRKRLEKELEIARSDLAHVERKLSNPSFVDRAAKEVVDKERVREGELKKTVVDIEKALSRFRHG